MPNCIALQSLLSFYCTALWLWRHVDAHQHTSKCMGILRTGVVDEELIKPQRRICIPWSLLCALSWFLFWKKRCSWNCLTDVTLFLNYWQNSKNIMWSLYDFFLCLVSSSFRFKVISDKAKQKSWCVVCGL